MFSVVSVCLPGRERVAERAEVDELRHLRLAHDQLRAVLDRLVVVREAVRQRVARVIGPLDDVDQLALEEVADAHAGDCSLSAVALAKADLSRSRLDQPDQVPTGRRRPGPATSPLASHGSWPGRPLKAGSASRRRPRQRQRQRRIDGLARPLSASRSCATSRSAWCMSSIDSGEPQCAHADALRQIDRRAAVRAVDDLDVLPQLGDLLRRQRPDEVLLLQKIEKRRQPAVIVRAAEVLEPRVALHVLRAPQPAVAARALHELAILRLRLATRARRWRETSSRVAPGVSCRFSLPSNHTDWHGSQRSTSIVRPRWPSSMCGSIGWSRSEDNSLPLDSTGLRASS